jgi:transformation/transcription domain-associated protein
VYSQAKLAQHRTVCSIWIQVLSQTPRADILFTLILLFTRKVLVDTADLLEFIYQKLIPTASPQLYREVLTTFFRALDDPDLPQGQVVQFARIVVIPVLHNAFARQDIASDVVDADVLREFHSRIWERDNQYNPSDRMKLEFLHMTDAIVQRQPPGWDRVKGDVIRFVWKLVISDDALARPLASLVAARFLASFGDDAGKFSRPLWIGLLRPIHENEGSPMIKQALDVLAPIMPARLPDGTI